MLIEQANHKQRAKTGDDAALAELVRGHGRSVRLVLGTYVDRWSAVEQLEIALWSAVRLETNHADITGLITSRTRDLALRYLEQADREAIQERDVLRRLVVQVALEDLRAPPPPVAPADLVQQRLQQVSEAQHTLLDLYYTRAVALQHLALQRNMLLDDLALESCVARAACDWRPAGATPAGDRLLPSLTEDLLSDSLDPDSRALLATSVTQDLGRSVRLERQVRLHLLLRALRGPFTQHDVQAITAAAAGLTDQARTQTASASGSGRTRMRQSDITRSSTSNRRPVSHQRAANRQPLLIMGGIGLALVVLGVLALPGRSTTPNQVTTASTTGPSEVESPVAPPLPSPATPGVSALRPQQLTPSTATPVPTTVTATTSVPEPRVVETATVAATPSSAARIETVVLINADTDQPIPGYESLPQDVTIRLSQLPTRRINFEFRAPPEIKSMIFTIPGCSLRKDGVEKGRPFSLSNTGPDFKPWTPSTNKTYTLTLSACSDDNGQKVVRRTSWQIRFSE
ncbi:MAG: hypothetical protein H0W78_19995 [Planctomycetes bacterium]|nr:hypothetical protein [Planctomycetota bacterium]